MFRVVGARYFSISLNTRHERFGVKRTRRILRPLRFRKQFTFLPALMRIKSRGRKPALRRASEGPHHAEGGETYDGRHHRCRGGRAFLSDPRGWGGNLTPQKSCWVDRNRVVYPSPPRHIGVYSWKSLGGGRVEKGWGGRPANSRAGEGGMGSAWEEALRGGTGAQYSGSGAGKGETTVGREKKHRKQRN